jgi:hypothetical protein
MVGLRPELSEIKAFGTDGEEALGDAFQCQFPNSVHLLCFQDCIVRKLRDMGICGFLIKLFIDDIFGKQEGTHRFNGLVGI